MKESKQTGKTAKRPNCKKHFNFSPFFFRSKGAFLLHERAFNLNLSLHVYHTLALGSRYSPSRMSFHRSQPISRRVPAATMTRPYTAAAAYTYTSQPVNLGRNRDKAIWEPTATIPKTHMPHSAQKNQVSCSRALVHMRVGEDRRQ